MAQEPSEQNENDLADSRIGFKPSEIFTPQEPEKDQHFTEKDDEDSVPNPTRRALVIGGGIATVLGALGLARWLRGGQSNSAVPQQSSEPKPTSTPDPLVEQAHHLPPTIEDPEPLLNLKAAQNRWEEYMKDPRHFIDKNKEWMVKEDRVVGKDGLAFQTFPGPITNRGENPDIIVQRLKPGEPVGGTSIKIGKDPSGNEWGMTTRAGKVVFYNLDDTEAPPKQS